MITYKISKGDWSTYKNFNTIIEAQDWTYTNLGVDYLVDFSNDLILEPPSKEDILRMDKDFGARLIDMFLIDNRLIEPTITPSESLQILENFSVIEKLASLGDITSVKLLLSGVQTDTRLFTQERKDKYLNLINSYKS
jgi:hypothetical protein